MLEVDQLRVRAAVAAGRIAMRGYDEWKTHNPADDYLGPDPDEEEDEDLSGCTCPHKLGAGGVRMIDRDCPVHGIDPDAEYEKMRDDRDFP